MTLKLLLDVASRRGALPDSRRDLYQQGCLALCEEADDARRRARGARAALTAGQRLAVAQRIAGVLTLSAQPALAPGPVSCLAEALAISTLAGGTELDRTTGVPIEFDVDERAVQDALRCGLFTNVGEGLLSFAHQSYAEFLCGCWLAGADFAEAQLDDLLFAGTDEGLRVVPQLRATAGWLGAWSEPFRRRLFERDPAVLLRADPVATMADERALLVEALLSAVGSFELGRFDLPVRNALTHLHHPDLERQLRGVLKDPDASFRAREMAADIAGACRVTALVPTLLEVTLDNGETIAFRVAAVHALARLGDGESLRALIPLAVDPQPRDVEDRLKGAALSAVWPDHLRVDELLGALTPPKRRSLSGTYTHFLRAQLVPGIDDTDLLRAVRDVAAWPDAALHPFDALADAREQLLVRAVGRVDDEEVADALADAIYAGVMDHASVFSDEVGRRHADLFAGAGTRRPIVERLLVRDHSKGDFDSGALAICTPPLARREDLAWVPRPHSAGHRYTGGALVGTACGSARGVPGGRRGDLRGSPGEPGVGRTDRLSLRGRRDPLRGGAPDARALSPRAGSDDTS